ncbi:hypothetical protein H0194_04690 [Corynebacterium incognita]|uniref:Uncharacterized protein n=1 Tax=Corynebacterium incognita TaxID=2754725 RepID=A0A7G7CRR2_9CORY|nr:hypothetical protein [Corynebacterium incognita]QNE90278.1 hypothetical protein H0194_04690 [Corynebacterium incognita]
MRTLADMPLAQRSECVGMWCNIGPHEPGIDAGNRLFVLRSSSNYQGAQHVKLLDPISGVSEYISFKNVTLRPDLPRAWTPNGAPVPGEWEDGTSNFFVNESQLSPNAGSTGWTHRRWVGEWEPC